MQRMNPPRGMGPMGPGPQVTACLSVCPSAWLSVCTRLLSSCRVCQSFLVAQLAGVRGEGVTRSPTPLSAHGWAGPTATRSSPSLAGVRQS